MENCAIFKRSKIFRVMGVFFTIFEKVEKDIFARNFFKMSPMDLKMCAKKNL